MSNSESAVIVTGIAGNLGVRLLQEIEDFEVFGVDFRPMRAEPAHPRFHFRAMDLGEEPSCQQLVELLRSTGARSVVHLAFVIDPVRTGVLDVDRMWRINVAGTARVLEAVAVINRTGGAVKKLIFISSVSAYGSDLPGQVTEDYPLGGHTLPYAIHKRQADQVVQARAASLGPCSTYILRPHIFAGASMQNYLINILRGTPYGQGRWGQRLQRRGKRLPALIPFGDKYMQTRFQYVHVDDMARLLSWLLRYQEPAPGVTILNVAGSGEPLTFERCAQIAGTKIRRLPGKAGCRIVLSLGWKLGIACVPAAAVPYFTGSYLMDTTRLERILGKDYSQVMRHTVEQALADSFRTAQPEASQQSASSSAR
jgi:nucleoside-diphosphate-sugar epimerase